METEIININKEYIKREINNHIEKLFIEINKLSKEKEWLLKKLNENEKNRVTLARAYAMKIGVIMTKNKFIKLKSSHKHT